MSQLFFYAMKFGYTRVSTRDQNLELQLDALNKAGCELIYQERVSGAGASRPELNKLLNQLRTGDTVYIYKLDRLGRSLRHLPTVIAAHRPQVPDGPKSYARGASRFRANSWGWHWCWMSQWRWQPAANHFPCSFV